jgi:hypothetical protein
VHDGTAAEIPQCYAQRQALYKQNKTALSDLEAKSRGSGVIHNLQGIGEQAQLGTVTQASIPIPITSTERRETLDSKDNEA